ncbi:MAG: GTP 3',8-cyclase MoaA [Cyanobacteria bacterium]|nr:GTP 3',8-cyclase MoaA [Cyanobacteria bacterium CG_2015-16_32_12]NCO78352.1 GTP 3',8-cyclase MoaA [Cyanobacteria bacterium CG_2015-22_32_23]NCQ05329.1 GTP 3',8-cyclase MoaA [Cyanobacteria bacterium CG_2015-09_32_10]NCQ41210.1 GTP 3',8-cyclase MoaA [Cyanobacteria bacterium CG_2015-04_32_10]NCS84110.1 GTP 3',8-cyclase MoaA [Cyanobacteria bacterium CG_2015-02_32_10]
MNKIDYLRISLIDKCNFRCQYCMPEDQELSYLLSSEILTKSELLTLIKEVFIPLGFTKFRLTGGEPLLRPDLPQIVTEIINLPQTEDVALTTNGYLLQEKSHLLFNAGLRRINISLDSLNPQTFDKIIGNKNRTRWHKTWTGIQTAYEVGFNPLKLNVVIIPDVNDHEILELAALTIQRNWHVRFIEFMPIGNSQLFSEKAWIPSSEIRTQIKAKWGLEESNIKGNGPADVFKIPHSKGTLGFISQMSECFCDRCNRIRLSADGWLRPCLLNETGQIDLKTALRQGMKSEKMREKVAELLLLKPDINFKERDSGTQNNNYMRTMSQIGG